MRSEGRLTGVSGWGTGSMVSLRKPLCLPVFVGKESPTKCIRV